MRSRRTAFYLALALGVTGAGIVAEQTYLGAKGIVARGLVALAWARTLERGEPVNPWPWADLHPIAELEFPGRGLRRAVLTGATGGSLAFGVGHVAGTSAPNQPGTCALAGHKDGAFAFLQQVRPGEAIHLRTMMSLVRYRVVGTAVVEESQIGVLAPAHGTRLVLITCYPFDLQGRSDQRWVVECEAEIPCPVPGGRPRAAGATIRA
jgi:sortase A